MSLGKTLLMRKTIVMIEKERDDRQRQAPEHVSRHLPPVPQMQAGRRTVVRRPAGQASTQTAAAWSRNICPSAETRTPVNFFEYPEM